MRLQKFCSGNTVSLGINYRQNKNQNKKSSLKVETNLSLSKEYLNLSYSFPIIYFEFCFYNNLKNYFTSILKDDNRTISNLKKIAQQKSIIEIKRQPT